MTQVNVWSDHDAVASGRPGVSDVPDDRTKEAVFLFQNNLPYLRKDSTVRRYQNFPDHPASDENALKPPVSPGWRGDFKMVYDMKEAARRLYDTVIMINDKPYLVVGITNRDTISLVLHDSREKTAVVSLADLSSLRSPLPGYINVDDRAFYLFRVTSSYNKHSLHSQNSYILEAGMTPNAITACGEHTALTGLTHRTVRPWEPQWVERTWSSQFMSHRIAVFRHVTKGPVQVEYNSRHVGELQGQKVILKNKDLRSPWLLAALREVALEA